MANKPKKLKRAGFWYRTGKGLKLMFSGISGEASTEANRIMDSAKERILGYFFMPDLRELIIALNLPDLEEKTDPETGEITKERKSLEEWRRYVKEKVELVDLENYVLLPAKLRDAVGQWGIRPSEVANYARMVASIRQEVHWAQYNIIDILIAEDRTSFEADSYIAYWLGKIKENYTQFQNAEGQIRGNQQKISALKFNGGIFFNVIAATERCADLYRDFYRHIEEASHDESSLQSFRDRFDELDDELFAELREIRRYGQGVSLDVDSRGRLGFLVEIRRQVNDLFLSKFNIKLLNQDEKSLEQISRECNDNQGLVSNLAALGTIIDKINVTELKPRLKRTPPEGSINILEQFLSENYPNHDRRIIKNLRDIITIRNQWPIHDSTSKGVKLVFEIYGTYPVDDKNEFWSRILNLYTESLNGLKGLFTR
jgi:hypothetical protein